MVPVSVWFEIHAPDCVAAVTGRLLFKTKIFLLLTGYILATLPTQDVEKAINGQHILEAIGQLSLPELLVATKEIKPYNYAQLLLKKHASINFSTHYIYVKCMFRC